MQIFQSLFRLLFPFVEGVDGGLLGFEFELKGGFELGGRWGAFEDGGFD